MRNRHKTLWVDGMDFKRFDIMADGLIVLVAGKDGKICSKVLGKREV